MSRLKDAVVNVLDDDMAAPIFNSDDNINARTRRG